MSSSPWLALAALLVAAGCASPPDNLPADRDPSNPAAPEAAWTPPPDRLGKPVEPPAPEAPKPGAVWTCPMHPEIRQDGPGSCPKCHMDLVPAKDGADPGHEEHDHR